MQGVYFIYNYLIGEMVTLNEPSSTFKSLISTLYVSFKEARTSFNSISIFLSLFSSLVLAPFITKTLLFSSLFSSLKLVLISPSKFKYLLETGIVPLTVTLFG